MKSNTLISFDMSAQYRTWEPEVASDGNTYRKYATTPVAVPCLLTVNIAGNIQMMTAEPLQAFAIVQNLKDSRGTGFMEDQWYAVSRIVPVLDAFGAISSYRNSLATLDARLLGEPIVPPQEYPDIDQA